MADPVSVTNLTRDSLVCEHAELADRPLARMRGLLGRSALAPGRGLLITPAPSVHTAFMRFTIDALFLDHELRVVKTAAGLRPWRMTAARHAHSVLELGEGAIASAGVSAGDQLALIAPPVVPALPGAGTGTVLVVGRDRRFRAVVSTLLTRRGWSVEVLDRGGDAVAHAERIEADVVLLDASDSLAFVADTVVQIQAARRDTGLVVVSSASERSLRPLEILPKWGSFDELCGAIEASRPRRTEDRR